MGPILFGAFRKALSPFPKVPLHCQEDGIENRAYENVSRKV